MKRLMATAFCVSLFFLVVFICWSPSVADAQSINVAGRWTSNLGNVEFQQAGTRVSGTLRFSNGAVASIVGTLQGNTLSFRWNIGQQVQGDGVLTSDGDGNKLTGTYRDLTQGTSGPFILSRQNNAPRPNQTLRAEDILRLIPQLLPPGTQPGTDDSSARPHEPREPPPKAVPTETELARVPIAKLREFTYAAAHQLDVELSGLDNGAPWKQHLQLEQLQRDLSADRPAVPDEETRDRLRAVVQRFDNLAQDSKYKAVSDLWGFRTLHAALSQYSVPPATVYRRELSRDLSTLRASLDRVRSARS